MGRRFKSGCWLQFSREGGLGDRPIRPGSQLVQDLGDFHPLAAAFAAAGARVWVTDIDEAALAACPAAWRRERVDVADPAAMRGLFGRIEAEWGGLDVLCANAGVSGSTAPLEEQDYPAFKECMDITLGGAVLAAQGALPLMKRARQG